MGGGTDPGEVSKKKEKNAFTVLGVARFYHWGRENDQKERTGGKVGLGATRIIPCEQYYLEKSDISPNSDMAEKKRITERGQKDRKLGKRWGHTTLKRGGDPPLTTGDGRIGNSTAKPFTL